MVRPPIEAALRCRLPGIEKLGNGGDKLGRLAGHVDDGKFRVDLSGALGDLPAVHPYRAARAQAFSAWTEIAAARLAA
jgi:hypothetical protein